ncbi:MAG: hypothetical protein ABI877_12105 [Gemmatimonadaceae bacterium]
MSQRWYSAAAFYLVCVTLPSACGDSSGPATSAHHLVLVGRAERGMTLQLGVQDGKGVALARGAIVSVAVSPSDAAAALGDSALLLQRAGTLTVSATLSNGSVSTAVAVVAAPPRVVFDGVSGNNRDIYSVSLDGGELTKLTTSAGTDVTPTSAGGLVMFTSYRNGNAEIYSILLDGSGEHRLTNTRSNETVPALSPDARSVAYATDALGVTKVLIASRDVTGASRLWATSFGTPATIETSPAWNPTSDHLIFVATAGPAGLTSLFTAPAVSGASPALVAGSGSNSEFEPSWSPDGGRVAYSASAGGRTQIFVRDLNTRTVTQLTFGDENRGQPTWLADGRLVFVTFTSLTSARMAWLDPAAGSIGHEIPIAGVSTQHPSAVRP